MKKDWKTAKMGEIFDVRDGTHDSPKYEPNGYPLITSKNLKNGEVNYKKVKYVSKSDYDQINKRSKVEVGDILFAMIGTIGNPVVVNEEPDYAIKNVALIKNNKSNNSNFLKYYLESDFVIKKMIVEAKGTTQKFVGLGYLRKFPIPLVPLQEQQQIVHILDQAFAKIDQAIANIEQNIQNAEDLFQSKLNQIFSQQGEGWEEKKLGEVSNIMYGCTSKVVEKGNVQYVRITDIQKGKINWKNVPLVKISKEERLKYQLSKGDIVFARTGATTGKSYLMENPPNSVFASYLIRVQSDVEILMPSFLYLYFQSGSYWDIVKKGISGSAQGGFNASKLSNMIIHFPKDKNAQLNYVESISQIKKPMDIISEKYQNKLQNLEELKKSLLEKAFSGELTKNTLKWYY
jgi:type I restriction enzyme S subunit